MLNLDPATAERVAVIAAGARRAVVRHDDATSHPDALAEYLAAAGRLRGFVHAVVPVGKGLSVAARGGELT